MRNGFTKHPIKLITRNKMKEYKLMKDKYCHCCLFDNIELAITSCRKKSNGRYENHYHCRYCSCLSHDFENNNLREIGRMHILEKFIIGYIDKKIKELKQTEE